MIIGTHEGRRYVEGLDYTPLLTLREPAFTNFHGRLNIPVKHIVKGVLYSPVVYINSSDSREIIAPWGQSYTEVRYYIN